MSECKILVVDDDPTQQLIYHLLVHLLSGDLECAVEVVSCTSSKEALQVAVDSSCFRFIIIDLQLGEGGTVDKEFDGIGLLRQLLELFPEITRHYFILSNFLTHSVNTDGAISVVRNELKSKNPDVMIFSASKWLTLQLKNLMKQALSFC